MFRNILKSAALAVIFAGMAGQVHAACVLKAVNSKSIPGCKVIVGYSDGKKVGEFRSDLGSGKKMVGTTRACTEDSRYNTELGRITPPNKVTLAGQTYVLAGDCRSSTRE